MNITISRSIIFLTMPIVGSACATMHDGDTIREVVAGISSSCTIKRTPTTPIFKIQITFQNSTNEFIDVSPTSLTVAEGGSSKILDAKEILAFNEGRILNEKIASHNAALAAVPIAAVTLGALAAAAKGRSNFARGAKIGALFGTSVALHSVEHGLLHSNQQTSCKKITLAKNAFDPQHILGPRSIVPPKLGIRRSLIIQSNSILEGTELLKFCRKGPTDSCYHLRLKRHPIPNHSHGRHVTGAKPSYRFSCHAFASLDSENSQKMESSSRARPKPPARNF